MALPEYSVSVGMRQRSDAEKNRTKRPMLSPYLAEPTPGPPVETSDSGTMEAAEEVALRSYVIDS